MKVPAFFLLAALLCAAAPPLTAQSFGTPDRDVVEFPIEKDTAKKKALEALGDDDSLADWGKVWDVKNPHFGSFEIKEKDGNECAPAGRYVVVHFLAVEGPPYPKSFIFEAHLWKQVGGGGGFSMPDLISNFREGLSLCH